MYVQADPLGTPENWKISHIKMLHAKQQHKSVSYANIVVCKSARSRIKQSIYNMCAVGYKLYYHYRTIFDFSVPFRFKGHSQFAQPFYYSPKQIYHNWNMYDYLRFRMVFLYVNLLFLLEWANVNANEEPFKVISHNQHNVCKYPVSVTLIRS